MRPDAAMKIPFDSLCLAAALAEMRFLTGGRLQRAVQPDARTLVLGVYAEGKEHSLLFSCAPEFARVHLTAQRPPTAGEPPELAAAIRRNLDGGRVLAIRQIGFDRILRFTVGAGGQEFQLIAELTGKHANLILVGPDGRIVAAAHTVGRTKSVRPIIRGGRYEPPPFPPRRPIYEARSLDEFKDGEGASPFLRRLLLAQAGEIRDDEEAEDWARLQPVLDELRATVNASAYAPVESAEGVYPISLDALGPGAKPIPGYSLAADRHFARLENESGLLAQRTRLLGNLRRVLLARELALQELEQAADAARNARELQERAELILAYASQIEPGQRTLETPNYEGHPISISLDPELAPAENAQRLFDRAKHAKARAGFVADQIRRLSEDRTGLIGAIRRIEDATDPSVLEDEERRAKDRRWLRIQAPPAAAKEERPYEGHRIRELLGPGGVRVLYGENATSNDYLTQRVAKPNDYWLHVRGASSAHVVVRTDNRPERIGREALEFAARVAVAHSGSKHSGYVSVDYTLRKYVRKPRGAPAGTVTYTHEKTLSVDRR